MYLSHECPYLRGREGGGREGGRESSDYFRLGHSGVWGELGNGKRFFKQLPQFPRPASIILSELFLTSHCVAYNSSVHQSEY